METCHGCGVEKDPKVQEPFRLQEDLPETQMDPLIWLDCQPNDLDHGVWRRVRVCHACYHKLSPDLWISQRCWETIDPVVEFDDLPEMEDHEPRFVEYADTLDALQALHDDHVPGTDERFTPLIAKMGRLAATFSYSDMGRLTNYLRERYGTTDVAEYAAKGDGKVTWDFPAWVPALGLVVECNDLVQLGEGHFEYVVECPPAFETLTPEQLKVVSARRMGRRLHCRAFRCF